eukprot:TRINITY_DN11755_c0_g1_i1.p1 TRINITY_DN11755_c0_g1~~TRINITY_DN11755_c0_g1_i1.p1  ORF type:complete len:631 (-),score=65.59 TRINITY_DN11755_c0_g1_i1:367-2259(-)
MDSRNENLDSFELKRDSSKQSKIRQQRVSRRNGKSELPSSAKYAMEEWSLARRKLGAITLSTPFEIFMSAVALFNVIVIVVDVDSNTTCSETDGIDSCSPFWVELSSHLLLSVYTLELIIQFYVLQGLFWKSAWNYIDSAIAFIGYVEIALRYFLGDASTTGMGLSRIIRLLRIVRVVQLFRPVPELYQLVSGFAATLRTIFWGFFLVLIMIGMWSIITVELVHLVSLENMGADWEEDDCTNKYISVLRTSLLYFQMLIAGDGWGRCVDTIVHKSPGMFWIFAFATVTVQLGFINLVLAVIVDAASAARESDKELKAEERKREETDQIMLFREVLRDIDKNKNGSLSVDEFLEGFEGDKRFQNQLLALGLDREDLIDLMALMDTDDSGEVSYEEFTSCMLKAGKQDQGVQFMRLHLAIDRLGYILEERLDQQQATLSKLLAVQGIPEGTRPKLARVSSRVRAAAASRTAAKSSDNLFEESPNREVSRRGGTNCEPDEPRIANGAKLEGQSACQFEELFTRAANAFESVEKDFHHLGFSLEGRLQALLVKSVEHEAALALNVAQELVETMKKQTDEPRTSKVLSAYSVSCQLCPACQPRSVHWAETEYTVPDERLPGTPPKAALATRFWSS